MSEEKNSGCFGKAGIMILCLMVALGFIISIIYGLSSIDAEGWAGLIFVIFLIIIAIIYEKSH